MMIAVPVFASMCPLQSEADTRCGALLKQLHRIDERLRDPGQQGNAGNAPGKHEL
jgi:hypothetical protein